ncbi:hypothetical protein GQ54DRAFT_295179 [Martensiomyces pterosporus]|nr:hypothetical protein GQ54DRAFT_295179 [Martensiomyces pterosporus]
MASSITLTGTRSNVARQHPSSQPSQSHRITQPNIALRRLVQELNASRIYDIPEEEEEEEGHGNAAQDENHGQQRQRNVALRPSHGVTTHTTTVANRRHAHGDLMSLPLADTAASSLTPSRRRKVVTALRAKLRRLCHLLSYYLSMLVVDLSTTQVTYRPLQFTMY